MNIPPLPLHNNNSQVRTFSNGYIMVYGALKNCSSTTYIPRAISLIRKYFAALSREDPPSSQVCGRPTRNPVGGGGRGVAWRWTEVVENAIAEAGNSG